MNIEKGYLYHIYNQGNNKEKIFFEKENYLYFLRKVNKHISPYCDVLAWCLMPNHFHFLVYVKHEELEITTSARMARSTHPMTLSHRMSKERSFNDSIAIMLRSYTRGINKEQKRSGSLFRQKTKAINLSKPIGITPAWYQSFGVTMPNITIPEKAYPNVCYNYILENPVKAGLAKIATDWEFSSAKDIAGLRNGKLINREVIKKLLSSYSSDDSKSSDE